MMTEEIREDINDEPRARRNVSTNDRKASGGPESGSDNKKEGIENRDKVNMDQEERGAEGAKEQKCRPSARQAA